MTHVRWQADLHDEQSDSDGDDRIAESDDPPAIAFDAERAGPPGSPKGSVIGQG
jgi:hypothetical protein